MPGGVGEGHGRGKGGSYLRHGEGSGERNLRDEVFWRSDNCALSPEQFRHLLSCINTSPASTRRLLPGRSETAVFAIEIMAMYPGVAWHPQITVISTAPQPLNAPEAGYLCP